MTSAHTSGSDPPSSSLLGSPCTTCFRDLSSSPVQLLHPAGSRSTTTVVDRRIREMMLLTLSTCSSSSSSNKDCLNNYTAARANSPTGKFTLS